MTLQVGDKVFYPLHGAGIVESIEELEVKGEKKIYCGLNLPLKKMKVLFPFDKTSEFGIRQVAGRETIQKVKSIFNQTSDSELPEDPKIRQGVLLRKMEEGDLCGMAQIIRDLNCFKKDSKLNKGDKDILDKVRKMFISEYAVINDATVEQATAWITDQELQFV